jgi:hypothetical protein
VFHDIVEWAIANGYREFHSGSGPPPMKWSDLRYVSDIKEDSNAKEAIQG